MQISRVSTAALLTGVLSAGPVLARGEAELPGIRAHLRPVSFQFTLGQPVEVVLSIENTGDEAVTLQVPGVELSIPEAEMGLPLSHVFSGNASSGLTITTESGRRLDRPVGYRGPSEAPLLIIAANSTVGTKIDLREYFPVLRGTGQYRVEWQPYGGRFVSEPTTITIAPRKQVVIVTNEGSMTVRLFYEDAPKHVANFLELCQSDFYASKTFHRLEPGYMLLGGCPRADGTGIRPDGKRIPAEFNSRHHQKGSVSMALIPDDPNSASCQFFLCNTRQKDWDGRYTVFGQLEDEESFETLDRLMATPVDDQGRPLRTLTIRTVRVVDAPAAP